jgi:hypothetical protein
VIAVPAPPALRLVVVSLTPPALPPRVEDIADAAFEVHMGSRLSYPKSIGAWGHRTESTS